MGSLKANDNVSARLTGEKSEWIAMINNCGFASPMEMNMIVNEFVKQFQTDKCRLVRLVFGNLMSSLDRSGISFTVLNVGGPRRAELLRYIDLKVDSPNWPKVVNFEKNVSNLIPQNSTPEVK